MLRRSIDVHSAALERWHSDRSARSNDPAAPAPPPDLEAVLIHGELPGQTAELPEARCVQSPQPENGWLGQVDFDVAGAAGSGDFAIELLSRPGLQATPVRSSGDGPRDFGDFPFDGTRRARLLRDLGNGDRYAPRSPDLLSSSFSWPVAARACEGVAWCLELSGRATQNEARLAHPRQLGLRRSLLRMHLFEKGAPGSEAILSTWIRPAANEPGIVLRLLTTVNARDDGRVLASCETTYRL